MPNKAFITEQLVNWSLSDSITRIVLTIPATIDADITLGAVCIAILVMTITVQLVKNLPSLLELGILQHLDLSPDPKTSYRI